MHRAERTVQYTVSIMVVLSAVMLDIAQRQWLLTSIVLPLTLLTHVFTDRLGVLFLPRIVVALVSLGAIFYFYFYGQFAINSSTQQLNTIGNLLMAWSVVTQFQVKAERVYGSLAVFSLLAVVVAAVLNSGIVYGGLLFVYCITGCLAMKSLYLLREETAMAVRAATGDEEMRYIRQLTPGERTREPAVIAYQLAPAEPLSQGTLTWGSLRTTIMLIVTTILFSLVYFYLIPRAERTRWKQGSGVSGEQTVGFSDAITFEEMGEILESDRLAMRVAFFDEATNQPYRVYGDVYMYGKPLVEYTDVSGRPTWLGYDRRRFRLSRLPYARPNEDQEVVRMEVSLEAVRHDTRFGIFPATHSVVAGRNDPLRWSHSRHTIVSINHSHRDKEYYPDRYTIATTALRNGAHSSFSPAYETWPKFDGTPGISTSHRAELTKIDRKRFPRLIEQAEEIVSSLEGETDIIRTARALQDHFLSSNNGYQYTLDFSQVKRDKRMDPVEDFIANHRSGHCEYFATALTMMLRSQDIPARLIVGYRGGDFNPVGKYHQFFERDAHAWVEIFIERDEVPVNVFTESFVGTTGAWYRLDPTPVAAETQRLKRNQLDQWVDYAQFLWNDYVVDLDRSTQRTAVYDPFANSESGRLGRKWLITGNRSFSHSTGSLISQAWTSTAKYGTSGRATIVILAIAAATGLCLLPWMLIRLVRKKLSTSKSPSGSRAPVEFYRRLEKVVGGLGVQREPSQTPLELARAARNALIRLPEQSGESVAQTPLRITQWFYDIRFGNEELPVETLQQIEGDLAMLEEVVDASKRRRSKRPVKVSHP